MKGMKEEQELIRRILSGERNLYGHLVTRYQDMAFTLALRLMKSREDAEELVQDAFVKAFRKLDQYQGNSRFSTWMYSIVYREGLSRLRRKKEDWISFENDEVVEESDDQDLFLEVSLQDRKRYLTKALEELPSEVSALLTLYYYEDKNIGELEEITGWTASNVKIRLFRGRKKLESVLKRLLKNEWADL